MNGTRLYARRELLHALGLSAVLVAVAATLVLLLGGSPALLVPGLPILAVLFASFNPASPVVEFVARSLGRAAQPLRRRLVGARRTPPRSAARPALELLAGSRSLRAPPALV